MTHGVMDTERARCPSHGRARKRVIVGRTRPTADRPFASGGDRRHQPRS